MSRINLADVLRESDRPQRINLADALRPTTATTAGQVVQSPANGQTPSLEARPAQSPPSQATTPRVPSLPQQQSGLPSPDPSSFVGRGADILTADDDTATTGRMGPALTRQQQSERQAMSERRESFRQAGEITGAVREAVESVTPAQSTGRYLLQRLARGGATLTDVPAGILEMAGDVAKIPEFQMMAEGLSAFSEAGRLGTAVSDQQDPGAMLSFAGDVAEAAPQFGVQIGASVAGQAVGIPAPLTFAATAAGPVIAHKYTEAKDYYTSQGYSEDDAAYLASSEAVQAGLITSVVNKLGGERIFRNPLWSSAQQKVKQIAGRIATGAVVEGATEFGEAVLTHLASGVQRYLTDGNSETLDEMTTPEFWLQAGREGLIGATLGGAAGPVTGVGQTPSEPTIPLKRNEPIPTPPQETPDAQRQPEIVPRRQEAEEAQPTVRAEEVADETTTEAREPGDVPSQQTATPEVEGRESDQLDGDGGVEPQPLPTRLSDLRKMAKEMGLESKGTLAEVRNRVRAKQAPQGQPEGRVPTREGTTQRPVDAERGLPDARPTPSEQPPPQADSSRRRSSSPQSTSETGEGKPSKPEQVKETTEQRPSGEGRRSGMVLMENVAKPTQAALKRNLTAAGDLPQPVFEQKIKGDGWVNSQLFQTRSTIRDFDRAVNQAYGTKRLSPARKKQIDDVLKGDADPASLPEPVRDAVAKMRMEVDAMSQKMIGLGVVEGKTAATVAENMGVYLTRSYRVFDDPKWAEKVPKDIRNKAKALLRSEYPNRSEDEIDALIKNLLYEGKAAESPIALIRQAKLGSKDLSILTRRKGIAPEIRALWGEYRDPKQNYARSMAKMAHLIGNHQFLTEVRNEGLGTWFHDKPVTIDGIDYITRIAADESDVMRPLNGLYTSPEIKTAFEEAFASPQHGMAFRLYMQANATVKYAKTIGSVQTHIRNVLGNTGFAVANGHWRIARAGNAWQTTLTSLGAMNKQKWRDYYRELLELGVVNESPRANELHDVIRDASKKDVDDWMEVNALNVPKRVAKAFQSVYRAEDDVWKVYAYENELARYRKAWKDRPEKEIKERAAYIVRNTYPTYSLVPKGIKFLRRTPVVGTFVSFPWEVGRTAYHTVSIAAQELASPETRAIGAQRAAGALTAASLTGAIAIASRMLLGMTQEDDEDLRRFLPPWSKNSNLIHIGRGEDGKSLIVDLSYTDPHEYLKTPIIALMRGDNWQDAVFDAVKEATEPFFGEEILFGRIVDTLRNTTKTGGRIWNEQDTALQKTEAIVTHIGESFVPGTITSMNRIWKGMTGYVTPYGRGYDAKTEALAAFTGHRVMEVDVPQSLRFAARRSANDARDATALFSTVAGRSGTVTPDEIEDAWNRMDAARRKVFEESTKDAQAAIRQGMTERQVMQTLIESGWSRKNASAIIKGTYVPYRLTPQMRERIARSTETLGGLTGKNARQLMRERLEAISQATNRR